MSGQAGGFDFTVQCGEVLITHHGRLATTLRSERARQFLRDVKVEEPQKLMARLTGNYKRGNERLASQHSRNLGR